MIDLSNSRLPPYDHQRVGVEWITSKPAMMLADEMGAGKTKQTIDAAQVMYHAGSLQRVIIVCPASVRAVWYDPELGELAKHLWDSTPATITEYHVRMRTWYRGPSASAGRLEWVVTNYEFIRSKERLKFLMRASGQKTLLVLDESSAVKTASAQQTKSCVALRKRCGRILLLNGTPIANNPLDMYSQGNIMTPDILECSTMTHFKSRYAVMGGFENREVIKWLNLDDLQRRFAPYVLRRLKEDCLDLPPKMPPVTYSVALDPATWKLYKEMKDDMVAWLTEDATVTAQQAVVKALRLAQITSGFLGGVEREEVDDDEPPPDWMEALYATPPEAREPGAAPALTLGPGSTVEVSREKLDFFMSWLDDRLEADPSYKLLCWVRFRPELERLLRELRSAKKFQRLTVEAVYGGQKKLDRENALRALDPRTAPRGPVVVAGTLGTGAKGLNMTAAADMMDLSYDYSLEKYLQSRDRIHRPGQTRPVSYYDVVATGPNGQKTIDHHIVKARREKFSIADWTTKAWIRALMEE